MKRRCAAAAGALLLLVSLLALSLSAAAADKVYFMAVNETVLDLSDDTMPRVVGGVLYVPYTLFDPNTAGAGLGVFSSYNRTTGKVVIYSRTTSLTFDLNTDTSTAQGVVYREKAIIRNSMVFVPVDAVCQYFGLEWSLLTVEYGYVVRVKSSAAVLDDRGFTEAAYFAVRARYSSYIQSKTPPAADDPGAAAPETSPSPPAESPDGGDAEGARVYLAFRMEDGQGLDGLLEQLARYEVYGVFFCRPDQLRDRDDDIRTLTAAGHRVGLLLDADSLDGQREQAALGRELLAHIARAEAAGFLSEGLSDADRAVLGRELVLWTTTLDAVSAGRNQWQQSAAVTAVVRRNRRYFVLMDDTEQSVQALRTVLSQLSGEGCEFRLATEVTLASP